MKKIFLGGFLCFTAACSSSSVQVAEAPPPPTSLFGMPQGPWAEVGEVPVPSLPAFTPNLPEKVRLSNGITVLLLEDPSRPMVSLNLRFRAGVWDDPRGKTGLAALTSGLVRDGGTLQWPGDKLDEELDFLGAGISFSASATSTRASFSCLTEDLNQVFGMFHDLLLNPVFPEDKLEILKGQMLVSVLQRNDRPGPAATREARRAFYGVNDPRVRRMEAADLDAMGREDVVAFHRDFWGSRGALVAVLGDFDGEKMLARLESTLGTWPVQSAAESEIPTQAPRLEKGRVLLVDRADVNQAEIRFLMEGVRRDHPDWPALRLGSFVLGAGGFGSRMMRRIRAELGLTYGVSAYWSPGFEQEGLFTAQVATKNETAARVVEEMLSLMVDFLESGPGEEELEKARMRLLNSEVFRVDTPGKVLGRIADLEFHGYPWNLHEQVLAACRKLTHEQVLDACRRHLDPGRMQLFVMGNASAIDGGMDSFGPLESWNLDAPGTMSEGTGPETPHQAKEAGIALAERVLAAHGGRQAWASTSTLAFRVGPPEAEMSLLHPGKVRWVAVSGDTVLEHPPEAADASWFRFGTDPRFHLPLVLMALARGEVEVSSPAEGRLVVGTSLGETVLFTGEGGVVEGLAVDGLEFFFSAYSLIGGLRLPGVITPKATGGADAPSEREASRWRVDPAIDPSWFTEPKTNG